MKQQLLSIGPQTLQGCGSQERKTMNWILHGHHLASCLEAHFWNEIQGGSSEAEQMGNAQGIQEDSIDWKLQSRVLDRDQGQRQYTCAFTEPQL